MLTRQFNLLSVLFGTIPRLTGTEHVRELIAFDWDAGLVEDVNLSWSMRDSVPNPRYSPVCNVLR